MIGGARVPCKARVAPRAFAVQPLRVHLSLPCRRTEEPRSSLLAVPIPVLSPCCFALLIGCLHRPRPRSPAFLGIAYVALTRDHGVPSGAAQGTGGARGEAGHLRPAHPQQRPPPRIAGKRPHDAPVFWNFCYPM
jgi:hypothetical protein